MYFCTCFERKGTSMEDGRATQNDLIVGRNAVLEALQSGRPVDSVWVARGERTGSIAKILRLAIA